MPHTPEQKRLAMRRLRADPVYREQRNAKRRKHKDEPRFDRTSGQRTQAQKDATAKHARYTRELGQAVKHAESVSAPKDSWWATASRADWGQIVDTHTPRMQLSKFGQIKSNLPSAE